MMIRLFRDGVTSPNVVASVTWKGNPIDGKFIKNQGLLNENRKLIIHFQLSHLKLAFAQLLI